LVISAVTIFLKYLDVKIYSKYNLHDDLGTNMAIDKIDILLDQWKHERADLNMAPMGILGRLLCLGRIVSEGAIEVAARHEITLPEFDVLAILRRCGPPFQQSVGSLCEHSLLSSGAMTNRIDRLEKKKMVVRVQDKTDGRGVNVRITKKGLIAINNVLPDRVKEAHEKVAVLSKAEQSQLNYLLKKMLNKLEPTNLDIHEKEKMS
jgi:DNA-binding MarR family transcriptional regulator